MTTKPKRPPTLYLSYAQKDEALKQEFDDYLAVLQHTQFISGWIEHQIQPGTDWTQNTDPRLPTADIFLVLLSPALCASGYCTGTDVQMVFERTRTRQIRIIPVLLRPIDLRGTPFETILHVPRAGVAVSSSSQRDKIWREIDWDIRQVITSEY